MTFSFASRGDWKKTTRWLERNRRADQRRIIQRYAMIGLRALENATPVDSGETAASWDYDIRQGFRYTKIIYTNSHVNAGANIAILLQYGHGTGTGGWVEGQDYINPAVKQTFDQIASEAWKELTHG